MCGLNLYRSPMAVYWEKTTDTLDLSDNEAMRQGRDLENYVAQRFIEETGKKVRRSNKMCMIVAQQGNGTFHKDWKPNMMIPFQVLLERKLTVIDRLKAVNG